LPPAFSYNITSIITLEHHYNTNCTVRSSDSRTLRPSKTTEYGPLVPIGEYTHNITSGCATPLYGTIIMLYYTVLSLSNVVSVAIATTTNRPNLRCVTDRFPRPRVSTVPRIEVMYEIWISRTSIPGIKQFEGWTEHISLIFQFRTLISSRLSIVLNRMFEHNEHNIIQQNPW